MGGFYTGAGVRRRERGGRSELGCKIKLEVLLTLDVNFSILF